MIVSTVATAWHKSELLLLVNYEYNKAFNTDIPTKQLERLIVDMGSASGRVILVNERVVAGYLLDDDFVLTYVVADGYKKSKVWLELSKLMLADVQKYKVLKYKKLSPLMRLRSKVCKDGKIAVEELKQAVEKGAAIWEAKQKRSLASK